MEATHNLDFPTPSSGSASQCPPCARRGWQGFSQEVTGWPGLAGGSPGMLSHCVDAQRARAKSSGESRLAVCPDSSAPVHLPVTRGEPDGLSTTASRARGGQGAGYCGSDQRL